MRKGETSREKAQLKRASGAEVGNQRRVDEGRVDKVASEGLERAGDSLGVDGGTRRRLRRVLRRDEVGR